MNHFFNLISNIIFLDCIWIKKDKQKFDEIGKKMIKNLTGAFIIQY